MNRQTQCLRKLLTDSARAAMIANDRRSDPRFLAAVSLGSIYQASAASPYSRLGLPVCASHGVIICLRHKNRLPRGVEGAIVHANAAISLSDGKAA
jgi:hypothetical protein